MSECCGTAIQELLLGIIDREIKRFLFIQHFLLKSEELTRFLGGVKWSNLSELKILNTKAF